MNNKPRFIVETTTEIVLAGILVLIIGGSYFIGLQLNPVKAPEKTVLGIQATNEPWSFATLENVVQKNLVANDTSFVANYELALMGSGMNVYDFFTINNLAKTTQDYIVQASFADEDTEFFQLIGIVAGKENVILDGIEGKNYYDLKISVPANSSVTPSFRLSPYTEGKKTTQLELSVTKI